MKNVNLIAIGLAIFPALAFSQPTWNGLRFGMSELEAKQVLKERAVVPSGTEKFSNADFYVGWVVRALRINELWGVASLHFGAKTKKLIEVGILLDPPPGFDPYATELRIASLREELTKKYGLPFLEPACDADAAMCHVIWKDGGQTIEMDLLIPTHVTILRYRPVGSKSDI